MRPDFGERAIARVAPVDAVMWWPLTSKFEMFPTILVPDGAYMIDRRMGVYGHPLDLQALFFTSLRAAHELLPGQHPMREVGRAEQVALPIAGPRIARATTSRPRTEAHDDSGSTRSL